MDEPTEADDSSLSNEPPLEDFEPSPKRPPGPLSHKPSFYHAHQVVYYFALMTIACIGYWNYAWGDYLWLSQRSIVEDQEYWRLVTSLFAHSGLGHFLSNTPFLFIFGWFLTNYFGLLAFPLLPIVCGVIASMMTVAFYPEDVRLIGASGVIYAMVAIWVVLYVRYETAHSLWMRIFRSVGFCIVLLFPTTYHKQTSYLAHGAGFFVGMVLAILLMKWMSPRVFRERPESSRVNFLH